MKNIHEVLSQKITELKQAQKDVAALYAAPPLLAEPADAADIQKLLEEKQP